MSTKTAQTKTLNTLKEKFGYKNVMQVPKVVKVVLNTGIGSEKNKKKIEIMHDRLAKIAGQKVAPRPAKKSIASFKLREGDTASYQVTLRGKRMQDFLDRFLVVALPRTRDFRGISRDSVDEMGNLTVGVSEHTVFPETSDEDLSNVFGLSVTLVTTAKNRKEALSFFEHVGIPFKKSV